MSRFQRRFERFLDNPSSVRYAVGTITSVTVLAVVLGAVAVRVFDHEEYPTLGEALWFTLQTVTTVGYGDVTPADVVGRVVAAVVMLTAIGLLTVVTAAITSIFVDSARMRRKAHEHPDDTASLARVEELLADLGARLDRIERAIGDPGGDDQDAQ